MGKIDIKTILKLFSFLSLKLILALALGIGSLYFFIELTEEIIYEKSDVYGVDEIIRDSFNRDEIPSIEGLMRYFTYLGSIPFVIVCSAILFVLLIIRKKKIEYSYDIPVVVIGNTILNYLLKRIFDRPRPSGTYAVEVLGSSFPSGHSMLAFSFYGLLIYLSWVLISNKLIRTILNILLSLTILLVGASRVYLGVHYPTDVMAGFSAGAFWLVASLVSIRIIRKGLNEKANLDR